MSTRRHARQHEALLRLGSRLITLVTPDVQQGFALLPLPKESSVNLSGKRGMTLWLCDALCSKKICFRHDYPRGTSSDWSWRLLLPTGPGDWSWRLVFLAKCKVSVGLKFALHTSKKQPNSPQEWTKCPLFARILIDLQYLFSTFRVDKAVEISWLTMQSIAHWMLELLKSTTKLRVLATKGAVTIMHKHMWSVGAAAAKN